MTVTKGSLAISNETKDYLREWMQMNGGMAPRKQQLLDLKATAERIEQRPIDEQKIFRFCQNERSKLLKAERKQAEVEELRKEQALIETLRLFFEKTLERPCNALDVFKRLVTYYRSSHAPSDELISAWASSVNQSVNFVKEVINYLQLHYSHSDCSDNGSDRKSQSSQASSSRPTLATAASSGERVNVLNASPVLSTQQTPPKGAVNSSSATVTVLPVHTRASGRPALSLPPPSPIPFSSPVDVRHPVPRHFASPLLDPNISTASSPDVPLYRALQSQHPKPTPNESNSPPKLPLQTVTNTSTSSTHNPNSRPDISPGIRAAIARAVEQTSTNSATHALPPTNERVTITSSAVPNSQAGATTSSRVNPIPGVDYPALIRLRSANQQSPLSSAPNIPPSRHPTSPASTTSNPSLASTTTHQRSPPTVNTTRPPSVSSSSFSSSPIEIRESRPFTTPARPTIPSTSIHIPAESLTIEEWDTIHALRSAANKSSQITTALKRRHPAAPIPNVMRRLDEVCGQAQYWNEANTRGVFELWGFREKEEKGSSRSQ